MAIETLSVGNNSNVIYVAPSNSTNKEIADYVCDGTNDSNQINAAIQAAGTGKEIVLLDGKFNINEKLNVDKEGLTIRGIKDKTVVEQVSLKTSGNDTTSAIKGEITYSRAPLEEALERVGRRENGFLGRLFTGAAREIAASGRKHFLKYGRNRWRLIKKGPQGEILDEKDIKQLAGLGGRLGYLDVDMQERTLLLYLEQLELSISRLRGEMRERCRLSTALGMMGSLLLVILMY